jgi:hypothetical protein
MSAGQYLYNSGYKSGRQGPVAPNARLTDRWVEQRLNILHALSEFIENGDAPHIS